MVRDAMGLLRTLRQRSVEEARQALGACLKAESEAADRLRAVDDAAQRDRAAHEAIGDAFRFGDMFTRRGSALQAQRRAAEADLTAARVRSAAAHAVVAGARTEAEAVETLIGERAAAAQATASVAEQHAIDDMARDRFDSKPRQTAARGH